MPALALRRLALLLLLGATRAIAQAPVVDKVDPPDWWAGHSINPVRILVHGHDLGGATLACQWVTCSRVKVSARGTWLFADVTIPKGLAAGSYQLTLKTAGGSTTVPFSVRAPLPRAGRFQGFGPYDVIYAIMPDRFADGDSTNDDPAVSRGLHDRSNPRRYHGGDLEGIRKRLPYLKSLGVTALWINPIYDNTNVLDERERVEGRATTAYHGYHAIDYYAVDEHFGDLADFRRLVDEAHAQGIKIILDMVANHTSGYHPWVADSPTPTWYNGTAEHHLANTWQTWTLADPHSSAAVRKQTLDGWFVNLLPDLDQGDPETARYIIQNTLWWVGVSGMDGIRQDTWPYVPRAFWRDWMTAIRKEYPRLKVLGEVFEGDPSLVAFFQGGRTQFDGIDDKLDALFDYPVFFSLRGAFLQGRQLRDVANTLSHDRLYPDPSSLVTFLGNHDVSRFMGEQGATRDGLELAYTFLLTARGTPLLYYGDEIAMAGGGDPDNRRDFPGGWSEDPKDAFEQSGRTSDQQHVWAHVQRLLKLRARRQELRAAPMENVFVGEQAWVYRRGGTLVALNNDTTEVKVPLPRQARPLPADALGRCAAPKADSSGMVLTIPARAGCIF